MVCFFLSSLSPFLHVALDSIQKKKREREKERGKERRGGMIVPCSFDFECFLVELVDLDLVADDELGGELKQPFIQEVIQ